MFLSVFGNSQFLCMTSYCGSIVSEDEESGICGYDPGLDKIVIALMWITWNVDGLEGISHTCLIAESNPNRYKR